MKISNGVKAVLLIVLVLVIDQVVKIHIKTSMTIGQSIPVLGNWFQIRFIENPGMAFGLDIPGRWGKPVLTIFRILAVGGIGWYLVQLVKKQVSTGLILCVALIMAGAAGNIIDSLFYGLIFNESTYFEVATLFPEQGGYAPFLYGKVVDMLYFPVIQGHFPGWFPFQAGEEFIFFRPIFNLADSAISVGIVIILLFQKRFFKEEEAKLQTSPSEEEPRAKNQEPRSEEAVSH
ncbi:MAG: lipoprotein signal peptidase [Bacteroidales bacterium]